MPSSIDGDEVSSTTGSRFTLNNQQSLSARPRNTDSFDDDYINEFAPRPPTYNALSRISKDSKAQSGKVSSRLSGSVKQALSTFESDSVPISGSRASQGTYNKLITPNGGLNPIILTPGGRLNGQLLTPGGGLNGDLLTPTGGLRPSAMAALKNSLPTRGTPIPTLPRGEATPIPSTPRSVPASRGTPNSGVSRISRNTPASIRSPTGTPASQNLFAFTANTPSTNAFTFADSANFASIPTSASASAQLNALSAAVRSASLHSASKLSPKLLSSSAAGHPGSVNLRSASISAAPSGSVSAAQINPASIFAVAQSTPTSSRSKLAAGSSQYDNQSTKSFSETRSQISGVSDVRIERKGVSSAFAKSGGRSSTRNTGSQLGADNQSVGQGSFAGGSLFGDFATSQLETASQKQSNSPRLSQLNDAKSAFSEYNLSGVRQKLLYNIFLSKIQ